MRGESAGNRDPVWSGCTYDLNADSQSQDIGGIEYVETMVIAACVRRVSCIGVSFEASSARHGEIDAGGNSSQVGGPSSGE
jgi:hypothetical protein